MEYKIEKTLAEISSNATTAKRLTVIAWNGYPAKLDLRIWNRYAEEDRPGKGVTLSDDEAKTLLDALTAYFGKGKK